MKYNYIDLSGKERIETTDNDMLIRYPNSICLVKGDEMVMTNFKSLGNLDIKCVVNYDEFEISTIFI